MPPSFCSGEAISSATQNDIICALAAGTRMVLPLFPAPQRSKSKFSHGEWRVESEGDDDDDESDRLLLVFLNRYVTSAFNPSAFHMAARKSFPKSNPPLFHRN